MTAGSVYIMRKNYTHFKNNDIVHLCTEKKTFRLKKGDAKKSKALLYTYKAYIERIIDGDTIWVYIPWGFGFGVRQKLRLRGIDTPEIQTKN